MSSDKTQSKILHLKSALVSDVEISSFVLSRWPDSCIVSAFHCEPDKKNHWHVIVRFASATRWSALRSWLMSKDEHSYSAPARSWVRSVRYLLHLDNPEKTPIPYENLKHWNIDDSELSALLGSRKSPILSDLANCKGKSPFEAFEFLVCERGHLPSAVSSAIRCLIDLERYSTCSKILKPSKSSKTEELDSLLSCEISSDLSDEFHFFTPEEEFGGF